MPANVDEAQVPDETGAAPADHAAIFELVIAPAANASIPAEPVAYLVACGAVL